MKKKFHFTTLLLSSVFSVFLCQAMNPPRPADKSWTERAGKALARSGRFINDEWWHGSHVPSIIRECEHGKFDRDATEKDARLNIGNFESALIELTEKKKPEEITFILEKALKMKSFKDSSSATILKEINKQKLTDARKIIEVRESTIAATTVAEINTLIADRARQMDEMRRLQTLIDNEFIETVPTATKTAAKLVILQQLQQSPQFSPVIISSNGQASSSTALGATTAAALSSSSSPSISSAHSHSAPVKSSSSSSPSTKSLLAAATAAGLISSTSPATMPSFSQTSLSAAATPFTPSLSRTPSQQNLSQSQGSGNNDDDDANH